MRWFKQFFYVLAVIALLTKPAVAQPGTALAQPFQWILNVWNQLVLPSENAEHQQTLPSEGSEQPQFSASKGFSSTPRSNSELFKKPFFPAQAQAKAVANEPPPFLFLISGRISVDLPAWVASLLERAFILAGLQEGTVDEKRFVTFLQSIGSDIQSFSHLRAVAEVYQKRQEFIINSQDIREIPDIDDTALIEIRNAGKQNLLVKDSEQLRRIRGIINETPELQGQLLAMVQNSQEPEVGGARLVQPWQKLVVISDLPKNKQQAQAIFGKDTHLAQTDLNSLQEQYDEWRQQIKGSKNIREVDLSKIEQGLASLVKAQLENLDSNEMAFLIGEHRDGAIHFHDGSRLDLETIRTKGIFHVLACNSYRSVGKEPSLTGATTDFISFKLAFKVVSKVIDMMRAGTEGKEPTQRALLLQMQTDGIPLTAVASRTIVSYPENSQAA